MNISEIVHVLSELTNGHKKLLEISKDKAQLIIKNDMDGFQKLLAKERKEIRLLEQIESKREQLTYKYIEEHKLESNEISVTAILEQLDDEVEQELLEKAAIDLIEVITDLKAKEETNRELIAQSMRFIQFSLDVLQPSLKKMNYGQSRPNASEGRSVFDSKA